MGKVPVIRNYDPAGPIMHPDDPKRFDEPCDGNDHSVTAPVTRSPPTAWEQVGLTEEEWNGLEIPKFLRRTEPVASVSTTPLGSPPATVPAAAASAGTPSGPPSSPVTVSGVTGGMFDQFRVDPEEIESKIRHEADRRWRAWVPTKEHLSRPRKSYYLKEVRKEFYP